MGLTQFGAVQGGLLASLRKENSGAQSADVNDPDNSKNVFSRFRPPYFYADGIGGAASTSDAGINQFRDGEGNAFDIRLEQAHAGGTIGTKHDRGLNLGLDATGGDGVAVDLGYGASASEIDNCRGRFVIGTDQDFYLRVRLEIGDVSDTSMCAVGFVGNAAGWTDDGNLDTYGNYAALNVDGGTINIETRLNTGTASVTSTTDTVADWSSTGNVVDLEVRVSSAGAVNFLINGAEPTVDVTSFTFDSTDVVNAVFILISDVDSDPGVVLHEWESGYLSSRGLTGISDVTSGV